MPLGFLLSAAGASALAIPPIAPITGDDIAGTETGAQIVEAAQDRYERMTVPVTIEGHGPFRFMIDTGSQATVVTRRLSEKLQLRPAGMATLVGIASRALVHLVELDGLEFAARVFDNITAPILEARNIGADGILGLDSLQDMRVLIDFKAQTIAVNNARKLGGNRGYEIIVRARRKLGRLIITDAMIDGVKTAVIIDTGAQESIANLALRRKLRASRIKSTITRDVNGAALSGTLDVARSMKIQGMQIRNIPITFADSPAFKALGMNNRPTLILGMSSLRLFDRVAIDFESRQILFDLPGSAR